MNKGFKVIVFLFLVIVILLLAFLFVPAKKSEINQVCFSQNCLNIEIAKTALQKEQGLMFRTQLDKDKGMLFVFDKESNYPFWMKNVLIPLDIIWINQNNEVVFIAENAKPCQQDECLNIDPQQEAAYVLEINGGMVKELNLRVGDIVSLNY